MFDMSVRHVHIVNTDLYFSELTGSGNKREREHETELRLIAAALGDGCVLCHDAVGRPFIEGYDGCVSISHSSQTVCLALSRVEHIGVDIEQVSDRIERVKEKVLDESSLRELDLLSPSLRLRLLTKCWCVKEAVFKVEGESAGLLGEKVEVSPIDMLRERSRVLSSRWAYDIYEVESGDEMCVLAVRRESCASIDSLIIERKRCGVRQLALLLDPEKTGESEVRRLRESCGDRLPHLIFIGGSAFVASLDDYVDMVKRVFETVPVLLFPGHRSQVSAKADALLFLSVVSGRNAQVLIGQQVLSSMVVKRMGLETLPMGYVLIDGGRESSVERASGTRGISQDDVDEIVATCVASSMLGMRYTYLEAGSGALKSVSSEVIRCVRREIEGVLIVGGGIRTREQMQAAFEAGADIVVIGNHFEAHAEEIGCFLDCL